MHWLCHNRCAGLCTVALNDSKKREKKRKSMALFGSFVFSAQIGSSHWNFSTLNYQLEFNLSSFSIYKTTFATMCAPLPVYHYFSVAFVWWIHDSFEMFLAWQMRMYWQAPKQTNADQNENELFSSPFESVKTENDGHVSIEH